MHQSPHNEVFPIWVGVLSISTFLIAALIFAAIDSGRQYPPEVVKKQAVNRNGD
ncbi:MAG: hypothetical protein ABL888_04135 [Pirellulaceae bacterium]